MMVATMFFTVLTIFTTIFTVEGVATDADFPMMKDVCFTDSRSELAVGKWVATTITSSTTFVVLELEPEPETKPETELEPEPEPEPENTEVDLSWCQWCHIWKLCVLAGTGRFVLRFVNKKGRQPRFSFKNFENVKLRKDFIEILGSIDKEQLTKSLSLCDLDEIKERMVDYLIKYINTDKLVAGTHSDSWKETVSQEMNESQLRAFYKSKVDDILSVSSIEKNDKTLSSYLKKIIANFLMGELGGFLIADKRSDLSTSAISHLKTVKYLRMKYFLSQVVKSGVVFCPEHDQEIIDIEGTNSIRFNPFVHKGNMSKVMYFPHTHQVTELTPADVTAHMTKAGKNTDGYEKYKDRFGVVHVQGPGLFENGYHVICVHLKSTATKNDFVKNGKEYAFIKSVINSFEGNVMLMGDFNAPVFEEGIKYFGLEETDRSTYPVHDGGEDHDFNLTHGFTRVSTYSLDDVAVKERSANCGVNPQVGKAGQRQYNTDHVFIKTADTMTTECTLFPTSNDGKKVILPLLTDTQEKDWVSDHQAVITEVNGTTVVVFNTLSDCCSDSQAFKDILSGSEVDIARQEFNEILALLTNTIFTTL
jgi:hypothetical protein